VKIQPLFLACAGALALAACSGHGGSGNVVPNASGPGTINQNHTSSDVRPLCVAPPAPGYANCFALVRTDQYFPVAPQYSAQRLTQDQTRHLETASGFFSALDPAHIQSAYGLTSLVSTHGSGQTVGIVDAFNDPTAEHDLGVYRARFGLSACTVANGCLKILNESGHTSPLPAFDPGWAGEISLDLDMVSATCPKCKIVLIEATTNSFSDLGKSVVAAHAAGANQLSNSYGGPEFAASNSNYSISGAVVTASSGDSSWFAGPQQPCSFATVVCVGGTAIYTYNSTRGWIESAWTGDSTQLGGGSGCSKLVAKPAWQTAVASCASSKRAEVDISAVADPFNPGILVYQGYSGVTPGYYVFGGTSASSPIIASIYGLAGNASTELNAQSLWVAGAAHSTSLNDTVIGSNGMTDGFTNAVGQTCTPVLICYSMPGYDGPTGNGTPNGIGAF
jgi:subtilase family serine protease